MDDHFVIILTTLPAGHDAGPLARTLVEERLAACVNVLPAMQSHYRWEGSLHEEAERQLVIKTTYGNVASVQHRLSALHPYEVPEFLVVSVAEASGAYAAWLRQSVDGPTR